MAIDRSGEWWRGSESADLDAYLKEFKAGGYEVECVSHATCGTCGDTVFALLFDDEEGYAERECCGCGESFLMLDSADVAEEAARDAAACPCGNEEFNVAVGYAFRQDGDEIRWVSIGLRCVKDGVLGVYADWKIDYGPSRQLVDQA